MRVTIRSIEAEEWPLWRDLRLQSLGDSPDAFRSTLEEERTQSDEWWAEIIGSTANHPRGGLWIAEEGGEAVGCCSVDSVLISTFSMSARCG
jgi:RimJ/RimL family protein N-acetyltransferase